MSDSNVIDSCMPNRQEQLEIWERLPLTDEQRIRVIEAMREEAANAAMSDSDSGEDQKEAPRDEAQAEAEVERTAVEN